MHSARQHPTWAATMVLACALAGVGGCACAGPTAAPKPDNSPNLLFSPTGPSYAARDVPRSDWPSTTVFEDSDERIQYRERMIDVQGRSSLSQDYTFRRFTSTRTGVRRR